MSEPVLQTLTPVTHNLGAFEVRRVLPSPARTMVGPFIFFDQMGPAEFLTGQGIDVRPHPHIGLATVTYLLNGKMHHRDSLGTDAWIEPGEVNLMLAGRGITHSERTDGALRHAPHHLFGLQTWLALPKDQEDSEADFRNLPAAALPVLEGEGKSVRLILGNAACGEEIVEPAAFADGLEDLRGRQVGGLQFGADGLEPFEDGCLVGKDLLGQREEAFRRSAAHQHGHRGIVRITHEVAEFEAHRALGDIIFAQAREALLGKFGAVRARERGEFDQLDRRIGVTHQHAAIGRDSRGFRPFGACRGGHGGAVAGRPALICGLFVAGGHQQQCGCCEK